MEGGTVYPFQAKTIAGMQYCHVMLLSFAMRRACVGWLLVQRGQEKWGADLIQPAELPLA